MRFTVRFLDDPNVTETVQWQIKRPGHAWKNISGATGNTYIKTNVSRAWDNFKFRAVVTNSAGFVKSVAAKLDVI